MALNIKDPETDRLVRALADKTGLSLTEAIKLAVAHELDGLAKEGAKGSGRAGIAAQLKEIGRRCRGEIDESVNSLDHGELLYDEHGLPR